MKGKVFKSSMDVYQDQAQILFNFYKDAAEKIVAEEKKYEKAQEELENSKTNNAATLESASKKMIASYIGGAIGIALLFYSLFFGLVIIAGSSAFLLITYKKKKEAQDGNDNTDGNIADIEEKKKNIYRDYKIDKIGVVYVPVAKQIPFEGKSILIDYTGKVENFAFEMRQANNPQALSDTMQELEKISTKAPMVESDKEAEDIETDKYSSSIQHVKLYDYFGKLDRLLRAGSYQLSDVSTQNISLPLVKPDDDLVQVLKEFGTTEPGKAPVAQVFNIKRYDNEITQFRSLNMAQKTTEVENGKFEDVLKHLIRNVGVAVQTIATMKVASNNKLVDESNKLLFTILKNSYNHYSPLLEHDEIEKMRHTTFDYSESVESYKPFQLKASSEVRYDVLSGNWVAEDGSTTTMPFGISQLQEEIVAPIVKNLLNETRIERMRIYNDIKDQKMDYLNQWHRETNDFYGRNRTSSDEVLHLMRADMTQFLAAINTLNGLENIKKSMKKQLIEGADKPDEKAARKDDTAKTLASLELQSQQFKKSQDEFDDYMERLQEDIDNKAASFKYIEYYDASLRDKVAKDTVSAGDNIGKLDDRRRPLAYINPLYAETSVLPPKPSVDTSVTEQMSQNIATFANQSLTELK